MPLKAVLFDMDGVLIDSEPIHQASLVELLTSYGVPYSSDMHEEFVGVADSEVFRRLKERYPVLEPDVKSLVRARHAIFATLVDRPLTPLPGVIARLDEVRALGLKTAVVSSSSIDQIRQITTNLGIRDRFEDLVSGGMAERSKPAPDIYLLACERLGIAPAEVLVFEDSSPGVRAAQAAGARVIAVPCPATKGHDLSAADARFDTLDMFTIAQLRSRYFDPSPAN